MADLVRTRITERLVRSIMRKPRSILLCFHICVLYDVGHQDGTDYLVMEYLEGQTLAQPLAKGALPLDDALKIAIEIADALDKAHQQGVQPIPRQNRVLPAQLGRFLKSRTEITKDGPLFRKSDGNSDFQPTFAKVVRKFQKLDRIAKSCPTFQKVRRKLEKSADNAQSQTAFRISVRHLSKSVRFWKSQADFSKVGRLLKMSGNSGRSKTENRNFQPDFFNFRPTLQKGRQNLTFRSDFVKRRPHFQSRPYFCKSRLTFSESGLLLENWS